MWNPLANLPQSNAGALSAYGQPTQVAPVPGMPPQMPGLHPLFGAHRNKQGGPITDGGFPVPMMPPTGVGMVPGVPGSVGLNPGDPNDPNNGGHMTDFRAALDAWRNQKPDRFNGGQNFHDMFAAMPAGSNRMDARQQWRTDVFDPWRQSVSDWRDTRPMRSGF